MKLKITALFIFMLIAGTTFSQKKELNQRMEDYLNIRNTITDDKEKELARIKSFLIEDRNPDSLAAIRYNLWKDELAKFGKDKDRIQRIDVLKSSPVGVVKTQKLRTYQIKKKNGKTRPEQVSFRFIYTWEKRDGVWYLRNVSQLPNPQY